MADRKRTNASVKRGSRSRLIFLAIIVVLLIAILIVVKNIINLRLEKNRLTDQEKELQNKKDELTAELQGVDDLDYIEEQARKLLKMIKPGEVLYILNGNDPRPEGGSSSDDEPKIPLPGGTTSVQEADDAEEQDYYTEDEAYSEDDYSESDPEPDSEPESEPEYESESESYSEDDYGESEDYTESEPSDDE